MMGFDIGKLRGVFPPVVTPLTEDEKLDEDGLKRLVDWLLEGGVHGLYMLGTTGEFPGLKQDVKVRAVEIARFEAGPDVPVLAGAGETSTTRAVELAWLLEQAGADVVFSTPPFYFFYSQQELEDYYIVLANAVNVPVFLYNIPQLTKVALEPGTVRALAARPDVVGIKDSSGNFANYLQHIETARCTGRFTTFIGSEVLGGASVLMGGDGIVASTANVAPALWAELYRAATSGDIEQTAALQERVARVTRITGQFGNAPGCKAALEVLGVIQRHVVAPHRALTNDQLNHVRGLLQQAELL